MVASLAAAQSPNVPPETFLAHLRSIRDAKRTQEDANMAVARVKKAAKRDGIDLDAFKLMEGLAKLDEDEAELRLRHLFEYSKWANLPIGTQLDAFGDHRVPPVKTKAAAEHDLWAAGDAGRAAGKKGEPKDNNPHNPGTELHVVWNKSWLDGQRVIADEMNGGGEVEATPKRTPPPPKRSRPKGNGSRRASH